MNLPRSIIHSSLACFPASTWREAKVARGVPGDDPHGKSEALC